MCASHRSREGMPPNSAAIQGVSRRSGRAVAGSEDAA
jgi:hypothetical protein